MRAGAGVTALLLLLSAVAAPALPPSAVTTGFLFESLTYGGMAYRFAVYVPRAYDGMRAWPLITFLHGKGESGTDGSSMLGEGLGPTLLARADEWPFIVLFPQKPLLDSEWEEHEEAVMEMLRTVRGRYRVDPSRLYLTGFSQGGHGTWVLGARHAGLWAALAPVCGYGSSPLPNRRAFHGPAADLAGPLAKTPVWTFHGEADKVIPAAATEELVGALRAAGATPKLTIYPGVGHNAWDRAYGDATLPAWLLSHRK
ncbi:MAG TPA: dienelactone hydrolase family protein [Thermoanaerobaculia bacterium]|nr:dienelactone hydrolase family protein [Thermoanaerobaculia bacterium]